MWSSSMVIFSYFSQVYILTSQKFQEGFLIIGILLSTYSIQFYLKWKQKNVHQETHADYSCASGALVQGHIFHLGECFQSPKSLGTEWKNIRFVKYDLFKVIALDNIFFTFSLSFDFEPGCFSKKLWNFESFVGKKFSWSFLSVPD